MVKGYLFHPIKGHELGCQVFYRGPNRRSSTTKSGNVLRGFYAMDTAAWGVETKTPTEVEVRRTSRKHIE